MRMIGAVLVFAASALMAAGPAVAAVDLLQRLTDKGIITEQEREELAKQQVTTSHKNSFAWATADGRFGAQLYGYGQVRYTFQDKDQGDNLSNFSVQRARLGVRGNAFLKDLRYQLYLNVYSGNEKNVSLFDWFVNYVPMKEVGLKVGQYKVPYAVQWNISAASLQFVDRTAVDGYFRFDRDTGVTVHGKVASMLAYDLGVYNGEGTNKNNPDDKHLWVARLMLEPLGKFPMAESDLQISQQPRVLVAGGMGYDDGVSSHSRSNLNGRLAALGTSNVTQYDLFAGFKWMGASTQAEYYHREIDPLDAGVDDETASGFYAQGGYFVWGKTLEVAARYEIFDPNHDRTDDLRQEYGVGVNYYLNGQRNKIQADFFRINTQKGASGSLDDNRLRVQYQLAF